MATGRYVTPRPAHPRAQGRALSLAKRRVALSLHAPLQRAGDPLTYPCCLAVRHWSSKQVIATWTGRGARVVPAGCHTLRWTRANNNPAGWMWPYTPLSQTPARPDQGPRGGAGAARGWRGGVVNIIKANPVPVLSRPASACRYAAAAER